MRRVTRNAIAMLSGILLLGMIALWIWPTGRPEYIPGMESSMHHASMQSLVREAKTAEDHATLAQHYEDTARRLDDYASRQERLATIYAATMAGRRPLQGLATHCANVAKNLRAAAAEDRELATMHRELARTLE